MFASMGNGRRDHDNKLKQMISFLQAENEILGNALEMEKKERKRHEDGAKQTDGCVLKLVKPVYHYPNI